MGSYFQIEPIGYVESPYQQKFAIPRQPGLAPAAVGRIRLVGNYNNADCVRGLEQFSHIWLSFLFHQTREKGWQPLVRPPRLGGNQKLGVFATRSTFRPNNLGLSVVQLNGIEVINKQVYLHIGAFDLLDNTPIIDIKPYIQFADAITDARSGFAQQPPKLLTVEFSQLAIQQLQHVEAQYPNLTALIEQVVAQDPRPAYKKAKQDSKVYGMNLYNLNIKWQLQTAEKALILAIEAVSKTTSEFLELSLKQSDKLISNNK